MPIPRRIALEDKTPDISNLMRFVLRISICSLPMVGAATMLKHESFWWSVGAWALCLSTLDVYGWLKYELLPYKRKVHDKE